MPLSSMLDELLGKLVDLQIMDRNPDLLFIKIFNKTTII